MSILIGSMFFDTAKQMKTYTFVKVDRVRAERKIISQIIWMLKKNA